MGPFIDGWAYEEWFGLCSIGDGKHGPFKRQLRKSYFTYKELWEKYRKIILAKFLITFFLVVFVFSFVYPQEQTEKKLGGGTVQLIQDEDGMWRITVNGQLYFIKGIEYRPIP
jgi:hypothetical protein